jgi:hypothetical protein
MAARADANESTAASKIFPISNLSCHFFYYTFLKKKMQHKQKIRINACKVIDKCFAIMYNIEDTERQCSFSGNTYGGMTSYETDH